MKKCTKCGGDLEDTDVFCGYCGGKQELQTALPVQKTGNTQSMPKVSKADDLDDLDDEYQPTKLDPARRKQKTREPISLSPETLKKLIIGGACLVLLVGGYFLYPLINKNSHNPETKSDIITTVATTTTVITTTTAPPETVTEPLPAFTEEDYRKLSEFLTQAFYDYKLTALKDENQLLHFGALMSCEQGEDETWKWGEVCSKEAVENILSRYFGIEKINHEKSSYYHNHEEVYGDYFVWISVGENASSLVYDVTNIEELPSGDFKISYDAKDSNSNEKVISGDITLKSFVYDGEDTWQIVAVGDFTIPKILFEKDDNKYGVAIPTNETLTLRQTPSTNAKSLVKIPYGEAVRVKNYKENELDSWSVGYHHDNNEWADWMENWDYVEFEGIYGYVLKDFIEFIN